MGELLGGDSWVQLPCTHPSSTHLLGATQSPSIHPSSTHLPGATQPLPGPTAQAPTGQSEPHAAAPTTTTTAAAPTTTIAAALSSNAAPTTTVAEEEDLELDVEPTQPVSSGAGDSVAPASGLAPTGYVAPTCQPLPGSEPTVQLAAHCPAAGSAPACLAAGAAALVRHGSGHAAPKLVLPACLPTTTSPATSDGFEVLAAGCMHVQQHTCGSIALSQAVLLRHTPSHPITPRLCVCAAADPSCFHRRKKATRQKS